SWLKSTGRKALKVEGSERLGSVHQCPHCKSTLMRPSRVQLKGAGDKVVLDAKGLPALRFKYEIVDGEKVLQWTDKGGYACRNAACSFVAGPAWSGKNRILKGYVDIPLARHSLCVDLELDDFQGGRRCSGCGYVHRTWMPSRYKRIGKRFSMIGVDEVHNIKNPSTAQSKAIMGANARQTARLHDRHSDAQSPAGCLQSPVLDIRQQQ